MSDLDDKLKDILTSYYGVDDFQANTLIPLIKQTFANEGYSTFRDRDGERYLTRAMALNEANLMTGQEWYDRFEKEIEAKYDFSEAYAVTVAKDAAKRAAGIA